MLSVGLKGQTEALVRLSPPVRFKITATPFAEPVSLRRRPCAIPLPLLFF
jgi:hypothetical protein